jgi:2-polyprenyl-6-methoxyphenol hydroxylase-like FAD-dependent oxidoreductase
MSPIGGVGINRAVQDAVAAANILLLPRRLRAVAAHHLQAVERRRTWQTRATQALQLLVQNKVIAPALGAKSQVRPQLLAKLLECMPSLRRIPGRLIGLGVRPEHISPALLAGSGPGDAAE